MHLTFEEGRPQSAPQLTTSMVSSLNADKEVMRSERQALVTALKSLACPVPVPENLPSHLERGAVSSEYVGRHGRQGSAEDARGPVRPAGAVLPACPARHVESTSPQACL